jgi:P27 family predicted phage terminase small subunit
MSSGPKLPKPPTHLRQDGKKLWRTVVSDYKLPPDALALLALACEAADRCGDCRRYVDEHGVAFTDKFGKPKMRPEAIAERDARAAVARILRQLGLDLEPIRPGPGRPAGR